MNELPLDIRNVLQRAKDADDPTPADHQRVRRSVMVALAASGVAGSAGTAKAIGSGAKAGIWGGGAVKAAGVALAVTAAGGIAAWALVDSRPTEAEHIGGAEATGATTGSAAVERAEPPPESRFAKGAGERPADTKPEALPENAPRPRARPTPRGLEHPEPTGLTRMTPKGSAPRGTAVTGDRSPSTSSGSAAKSRTATTRPTQPRDSEPEVTLIRRASQALGRGDPGAALEALRRHAEAYPRGVLAQERGALQVIALCQLGPSAEARSARDRFLDNAPRSPLAARVRAACGASSEE